MRYEKLKEGDVIVLTAEHAPLPIGRYVVAKTAFEGGGTGHGPGDIYPDGHHVYCETLTGLHRKISFYQSGCFTNMIEYIKPVGKAKRTWKEVK